MASVVVAAHLYWSRWGSFLDERKLLLMGGFSNGWALLGPDLTSQSEVLDALPLSMNARKIAFFLAGTWSLCMWLVLLLHLSKQWPLINHLVHIVTFPAQVGWSLFNLEAKSEAKDSSVQGLKSSSWFTFLTLPFFASLSPFGLFSALRFLLTFKSVGMVASAGMMGSLLRWFFWKVLAGSWQNYCSEHFWESL